VLRVEAAASLERITLDVSLHVVPGECYGLAGPSGAGKTSVLRAIAGLLRPHSGRVSCGEQVWLDTGTGRDVPPEQRGCGYVFQDYALFPHLNAWRNVAYPLRGLPRGERRRRALELLERFGLEAAADSPPGELSGGERQRLALARAIARRPGALLLDEPLSALDASTRASSTRELAEALRDLGVPTVLVTHDFAEAAQLGTRVGILESGAIVQEGSPSELASKPASAFVAGFTGAVVLTGNAHPGEGGLTLVDLDGSGTVASTDQAEGRVGASVHPWEITIEPGGAIQAHGSALNRLPATVSSITTIGNRARLGLTASQPLAAEITASSGRQLGLREGSPVVATWKAAATRLVAL
jgi:molybdate transport system ATP-binding protein